MNWESCESTSDMKLSSQEEYGLRCMLCLVDSKYGASRTIPEISDSEGISRHNVAKMLSILRKGGFVESVRGQNGGYVLARKPEHIFVSEILSVLGGPLFDPEFCDHFSGIPENCNHVSSTCSLAALWRRIQTAVDQIVNQLTLRDLKNHNFSMSENNNTDLLNII